MENKQRSISLSWLIVSTRDYKKESEWYWDKKNHCCYGVPVERVTGCISKDIQNYYKRFEKPESYFEDCVLMPELHELSIEDAAVYLRSWCKENNIEFLDDLPRYKRVEALYWGYDDLYKDEVDDDIYLFAQ